jgi:hypothetical protein
MRDITLDRQFVNLEALHADLRAALGGIVRGVSSGPYGLRLHLTDDASDSHIEQAVTLAFSHDPTRLTPRQQAEAERELQLELARAANATPLNLADYSASDLLLQTLARKVAWLEQELAALHDT